MEVTVCGSDGGLANHVSSILELFFSKLEFSGVENHPSSTAVCKNVANSVKSLFHGARPLNYIVDYFIIVLYFWFLWAIIKNCVRSLSITIIGGAIALRCSGVTEPSLLFLDECRLTTVF